MLEYINEINNPSVQFANEGSNYLACQRYLNYLEQLRSSFIVYLGMCEKVEILGFLGELEAAKGDIEKMGFAEIESNAISALFRSGIPGMDSKAQAIQDYQMLYKGILKSITKTITFINTVLSGQGEPVMQQAKNAEIVKEATDNVKMEQIETGVISGTSGLAKFLGCSKSMAFAIIDSEILKKEGIQYPTGKTWKFNRQKLQEYIEKHPDAFAHIRCKH